MSVFGRIADMFSKKNIKHFARTYGPMIQKAMDTDLAKVILGDRASGIKNLIGKGMSVAQLL